jgi:hypothetical protein
MAGYSKYGDEFSDSINAGNFSTDERISAFQGNAYHIAFSTPVNYIDLSGQAATLHSLKHELH